MIALIIVQIGLGLMMLRLSYMGLNVTKHLARIEASLKIK